MALLEVAHVPVAYMAQHTLFHHIPALQVLKLRIRVRVKVRVRVRVRIRIGIRVRVRVRVKAQKYTTSLYSVLI